MLRKVGLFWGLVGFISTLLIITSLTVAVFVLLRPEVVGQTQPYPPFSGSTLLPSLLLPLGLGLLVGYVFAWRFSRPVQAMSQAASRFSQGDLNARVQVRSAFPEFQLTADAFNQAAASLQQLEEQRRRLIADIAHELRTPLTALRVRLEALEDGVAQFSATELARLQNQVALLSRLVEDLQTLSLADAGQLTLRRQNLDLCGWLAEAVEGFRPRMQEKQVQLSLHLPFQPAWLQADAQRLTQVLYNLLDNALRYTPPGAEVSVALLWQGHWVIKVHDGGPGIPQAALPHLFERFYRAEPSRSRESGGSGLGLAIAKTLTELHGGTLSAYNAAGGGAVFELQLWAK